MDLQVELSSEAKKHFTVKETIMLRNFTQRLRLGLILWNDGLRKRKWI